MQEYSRHKLITMSTLITNVPLVDPPPRYASKLSGGLFGASVVDRVGRKRLLSTSFALGGVATLLMSGSEDASGLALLPSVALYYSALESVWSTLKTFTVEAFPTSVRGAAIGVATGVGFAGSSLALLLTPILMSVASAATPFKSSAAALFIASCLTWSLRTETAGAAITA